MSTNKEKIFIGVAWPYANGPLHLGHVAGAYLPADILARYHRTKGNEVLMVSGSDMHGTPITIRAEQEGKTPRQVAFQYHEGFLESWQKLGISFDIFTHTETPNHAERTKDIFSRLLEKGYIYRGTMLQPYCPNCRRFLPDRYTEGVCPHCGAPGTRGDQCDKCGKPLNAPDLIDPRCKICGTSPRFENSEHFFLKLSAFQSRLLSWAREQTHWKPNVLNFTLGLLQEGLKDRAITRDISWGINVPVPGFEGKRIYVWFEAVIGYLSASQEWASQRGNQEEWQRFWQGEAKTYYFIGKDNIPFHTIVWPAMLMGYGDLNLPTDVPANEFLTLEGRQISTSRNWAVWLPDYLERYDPDPLRYFLSINMPENGDADFSWREFYRRNDEELVATYGNLVHRVLTFTYRNFDGRIPTPGELDAGSQGILAQSEKSLQAEGELLARCRFREAMGLAMSLCQQTNRYLDAKSPWKTLQKNPQGTQSVLYTAVAVISCLKTMLYPFLPHSSSKLHLFFGLEGTAEAAGWRFHKPVPGSKLNPPQPLFAKLGLEGSHDQGS